MKREYKIQKTLVERPGNDVREYDVVEERVETRESQKRRRLAKLDELPSNCDLERIADSCGNVTEFGTERFAVYLEKFGVPLASGRRAWLRDGIYCRIGGGRCDLQISLVELAALLE
jgi:hypothetical protein